MFDLLESSTVPINSDYQKIENLRKTGDNFVPCTTVSEKENSYADQSNTQRINGWRPKRIINYIKWNLLAEKSIKKFSFLYIV